jgi:hypothetical protein
MFPVRFRFLNELAAELNAHGLQVGVDEGSICVGRPTWDRYANQFFTMVSAAPYIKHGQKAFFIYASEQYDENGELKKYSVKLCNAAKAEIKAWELDTKRGQDVGKGSAIRHVRFVR